MVKIECPDDPLTEDDVISTGIFDEEMPQNEHEIKNYFTLNNFNSMWSTGDPLPWTQDDLNEMCEMAIKMWNRDYKNYKK